MAGTLTITGVQHGKSDNIHAIGPFVITGVTVAMGHVVEVVLINGTNTIPIPSGATAVFLEFPADADPANRPALLDTAGGTSYMFVGPQGWCAWSIDSTAPANIIMTGGTSPSTSPTRFTFI
jgi:hypothetical protein